MSHFVVAVVTENPAALDAILQPFHEFECTGEDDQYVQDIDITGEIKPDDPNELTEALENEGLEDRVVSDEAEIDKENKHKYGYAVVKDGVLVKAVRRSNPNKKWDWWTIGGRWKNSLLTKTGRKVDQAKKSEIDFAKMRADAEAKAAEEYDAAIKVINGRPVPHWDHLRDVLFPGKIDEARAAYYNDPVMLDWKKAYPDSFFGPNPEDYDMPREKYIEAAGDTSFGAFAVVDSTGWHERGSMGWWGVVHDEKDKPSWGKQLLTILSAVPDDHYITMVDCHI